MASIEQQIKNQIKTPKSSFGSVGDFSSGLPEVFLKLGIWENLVIAAMKSGLREWAEKIQTQMRMGAPWQDRTGMARRSLVAYLQGDPIDIPAGATESPPKIKSGDDMVVVITGLMFYNIFLEMKDAGRYAIMWPTAVRNNAELMRILVRHGRSVT